ncbi:GerMN domain-containing protein [Streptomyces sp. NPDC059460]|uniref:AMIN-like domain-containing (lipo)protein n=1 Tax=Streptomyces sp. NPDC059460 TaxID=3346840 RepID=UPI0036C6F8C6
MITSRRLQVVACAGLLLASVPAVTLASAAPNSAPDRAVTSHAPAVSTLVAVRASHHPGFDRLVFQFSGPVPAERSVRYVPRVIADGSGLSVRVVGHAFLQVRFAPAIGHDDSGQITYRPRVLTFALPDVIQVVPAGDFEAVLNFGVGLARREPVRVSTLTSPSRMVIDIGTPFKTVTVKNYFIDRHRVATGHTPYTRPVNRPVIPPSTASGALQRLFAGPTQAEYDTGLRFVNSKATGFKKLSIRDGVARVTLTGGCHSNGSTVTVANEIVPTLKQFRSVHWVKIYDPSGHTQRPYGHSNSIPDCLEP